MYGEWRQTTLLISSQMFIHIQKQYRLLPNLPVFSTKHTPNLHGRRGGQQQDFPKNFHSRAADDRRVHFDGNLIRKTEPGRRKLNIYNISAGYKGHCRNLRGTRQVLSIMRGVRGDHYPTGFYRIIPWKVDGPGTRRFGERWRRRAGVLSP